jgi:SPP1 family predicted phage head-tail adaptor
MKEPRIGALRERMTLEEPARVSDGAGGWVLSWIAVADIWGLVRPLSGRERLRADQRAGRVSHEVFIRDRPGIVPAMRLRIGSRLLDILAVLPTERRSRLKCLCEERFL